MEQHVRFQSLFSLIKMEMNKPFGTTRQKVQISNFNARYIPEKEDPTFEEKQKKCANFRATLADDTSGSM